jgi:hypothetical protein
MNGRIPELRPRASLGIGRPHLRASEHDAPARALDGVAAQQHASLVHCRAGEAQWITQGGKNKTDWLSRWAIAVHARRGFWKAVVAIAAKNARMCGAMLARGEAFKLPAYER